MIPPFNISLCKGEFQIKSVSILLDTDITNGGANCLFFYVEFCRSGHNFCYFRQITVGCFFHAELLAVREVLMTMNSDKCI